MGKLVATFFLSCVVIPGALTSAQESNNAQQDASDEGDSRESVVVATVNSVPLQKSEVANHLLRTIGTRPDGLNETQFAKLQANALRQLVGQQIVIDYLKSKRVAATDQEVQLEVDRLKKRIESLGKTLNEFLAENNETLDTLKRGIKWQKSWSSYLDATLTDENLQRVFEADRRRFDGTELNVAHLLIKPKDAENPDDWKSSKRLMDELLAQIKSGQISWAQAVADYSEAASKDKQGDIGWIKLDGTMPGRFADAAFELQVGEISDPLRTPFGFHLIRCLDVKPGSRSWQDCGEELKLAAAKKLFNWVVEKHGDEVEVNFTGESPYFDMDSGELKTR